MAADQLQQGRHRLSLGRRRAPRCLARRSRTAGRMGAHVDGVLEPGPVRRDRRSRPTARCADLTAELTTMLGSTDPVERDEIAYPILATWISDGRLRRPAGRARRRHGRRADPSGSARPGTDSVFRRSFSALVLAECIARDNAPVAAARRARSSSGATGSAAGWCASATSAASCPGRGWAHAVAHGADALGAAGRVAAPRPQRADRAARRDRRPGARADAGPLIAAASPTGWRGPRMGSCAATWCRCG